MACKLLLLKPLTLGRHAKYVPAARQTVVGTGHWSRTNVIFSAACSSTRLLPCSSSRVLVGCQARTRRLVVELNLTNESCMYARARRLGVRKKARQHKYGTEPTRSGSLQASGSGCSELARQLDMQLSLRQRGCCWLPPRPPQPAIRTRAVKLPPQPTAARRPGM